MTTDPRLHRIVAAQPYPLLFATISGAHLYGFPSPDSDFDLRGAHVLPLEKVVGLEVRDETVQQEMIVPPDDSEGRARHSVRAEGGASVLASRLVGSLAPPQVVGAQGTDAPYHSNPLEMDIVSHDVRKFFGLLLKKNGYVLEQLFSPLVVLTTPEHEELKEICRTKLAGSETGAPGSGVITKHHSHHYFGFAETQWKLFLKESPRRVKPLLYVYRVLLTGIHLMRTGKIEANLATLNQAFRLPYIADLVARKLAGPEKSKLEDADIVFHEAEYQRLRGELQAAHDESQLPELPDDETRAALNDLLVRVRTHGLRG
jgi:predicted nucleotidyltransferase